MLEFVKIVLLGVLAATCYGIVHDQVTTRVCVEYFTIGHPPSVAGSSPTLLALVWGVVGTWRLGAMLGLATAAFARLGSRPRLSARQLARPVGVLILGVAAVSLLFGILGFLSAAHGATSLDEALASRVPEALHGRFIADLWAHRAAYLTSYFGGVLLWAWMVVRRQQLAANTAPRQS